MIEADAIILGSPVYVTDVSSEMKAFIDRTCLVSRANGNFLRRKVGLRSWLNAVGVLSTLLIP